MPSLCRKVVSNHLHDTENSVMGAAGYVSLSSADIETVSRLVPNPGLLGRGWLQQVHGCGCGLVFVQCAMNTDGCWPRHPN